MRVEEGEDARNLPLENNRPMGKYEVVDSFSSHLLKSPRRGTRRETIDKKKIHTENT